MSGGAGPAPVAQAVYARRGQVVTREIAGETILVPIRGDIADLRRIFSLNRSGAYVWGLLDGKRSVGEIAEMVGQRFAVDPGRAAADVAAFLAAAEAAGVVGPAGSDAA